MGQGSMRNGLLYVVLLAILAVFLFTTLRQGRETVETVPISQIAAEIKAGKIEAISEKDGELSVTYKGASPETATTRSRIEAGAELVKTLNTLGVTNEDLNGRQGGVSAQQPLGKLGPYPWRIPSDPPHRRVLLFHPPPSPGFRQPGLFLRQEQSTHVHRRQADRDL